MAGFEVEVTPFGVVRVAPGRVRGAQAAQDLVEEMQRAFREVPEPVPVLLDARAGGARGPAASRLLRESLRQCPPSYLAVVGAPLGQRLALRAAVHSSLVIRARFFEREEPALAWLRAAATPLLPPLRAAR